MTTAKYMQLLSNPDATLETRVKIDSVVYGPERIIFCEMTSGLLSDGDIGFGGCIEGQIDLSLRERSSNIPPMAKLEPETRLVAPDGTASEWSPMGVYYIDTRAEDYDGAITISGFDAMLKSEAVWWDPSVDAGEWPMTQSAAVADIVRCMGVQLDPRTVIDPAFTVDYPNNATMREILEEIAATNCGNWSMTRDGKLLLVPLGGFPPETSLLVDDEDGGAILFGSVRIVI